jgi:hypothetical protein
MQITDIKNVGTDHASVEKGSKVKKERKNISIFEGFPADHIGSHGKEKKPADRPGNGDKDAYSVGPGHLLRILENHLVGFQGKITGQDTVTVKPYRLVGTKGTGYKENEG